MRRRKGSGNGPAYLNQRARGLLKHIRTLGIPGTVSVSLYRKIQRLEPEEQAIFWGEEEYIKETPSTRERLETVANRAHIRNLHTLEPQ